MKPDIKETLVEINSNIQKFDFFKKDIQALEVSNELKNLLLKLLDEKIEEYNLIRKTINSREKTF